MLSEISHEKTNVACPPLGGTHGGRTHGDGKENAAPRKGLSGNFVVNRCACG